MESLAEKLGLYDMVGVLFPGVIGGVSIELLLPKEVFQHIISYENSFLIVSMFLIVSYVVGLVLQEITSILDRNIFKFRDRPKQNYLRKESKVIENDVERDIYSKMFKKYIKKSKIECDTNEKEQMESYYYYCASILETRGADGKVKRISSIYGMSRSLSFLYILLSLYMQQTGMKYWFVCLLLGVLFLVRTYRFSKFKVRVVLRQYRVISTKEWKQKL